MMETARREFWAIYHGYTVDGGYGDAIFEEEMVGVVSATENEIQEFIKKYNNPIVYDHPYDYLKAHFIRAEKIKITADISEIKPYGEIDYFGQQAREYQLRVKYDEEYGPNWMWSEERSEIYQKFNAELEAIRTNKRENE